MTTIIANRREILGSLSACAALFAWDRPCGLSIQALGIEPIARIAPGRMQLSLAAYSLRDWLKESKDGWDLFKFVDYCHAHAIPGAELTSYYFPADLTDAYIVELKEHCRRRGVSISGGAIANDFCQRDDAKRSRDIEHTKHWIDRYALLGAGAIRVFAGSQPKDEAWPTTRDRCIGALEEVCKYAHTRGVFLALENHGGVTARADGLLDIVRRVQAPSFGVNFDSGNFRSTDDPYAELAEIAPYAINAQIKVEIFPGGKRETADLGRILKILQESNYSGWVALEYEAEEPAIEAVPRWVQEIKKSLEALT
jgi:sugar phosphate isomerase/epimerase